ncbi:MAG: FAD-dependent pyridine nucleotide-disulfide oxidoreductase [Polaromonas sp.]|nr:FAD-dependent pyridine nucleotide-disulfide oxidoreductase [Polaromonas sp.]
MIGAGLAGLGAALFLARAQLSIVVYDGGPSRIEVVDQVREYLGFDGWTPADMLNQARQEASRYGAVIRQASVHRITPRQDGLFDVVCAEEHVVARSIVLATGLVDVLPPLTGLSAVWGRDLRVCPCFDGHEVRGKRFVVFGLPERLAQMSAWVSMWSSQVTLVSPHVFSADEADRSRLLGIAHVSAEVGGLVHEGEQLVAVLTSGGSAIDCDAAWIAMPYRAASGLAGGLCEVDELGLVLTDADGRSSRAGVFAVGNASARGALHHLAHAAAAGTHVGPVVTMFLLESRLAR